MDNNSFILNVIAKLNKQLSKSAINGDLKTLDNTMSVRVLAKLSKTLAKKELKKQLRELNDLYVNVGTKVKTGKNTKAQIQRNIKELQQTISDLEIGLKATKINKDIDSVRNRAQKKAQSTPISFNVEIGKAKLIADIEYLGKRYSKLFSNVSASNKYENILNHAYNVSDQKQLADAKAELAAFTSELKANGLAAQSVRDKWGKLIDRAKELFSAAAIIRTVIVQVKQSVSTFLELDTAI